MPLIHANSGNLQQIDVLFFCLVRPMQMLDVRPVA